MKKLFLIPLLTLMCSVTVWARQITLGGTGANYSNLANLKTAIDNGSLQLSATDSIMLGANQTFAKSGVYDFKNATVICGNYRFTHDRGGGEITIKNVMLKDAKNSGGAVNIQTSSASTVNFVNVKSDHNGATIGITKTQPSTAPTINIDEDCVIAGNIWSNGTYSIQLYGSANINNKGQLTKYVAVHRHADAQYLDAVVNLNNEGTITQGILADANQTVNIVNSGTLTQAVGNNGIFNLTNNGVATIYSDPTIMPSGYNAQYHGTISFSGTENIDIIKNGEPETVFDVVPSGTNATIHRYCYFTAGIGDLAIEEGYYWRARDGRIMEADGIVASVFHAATSETENFEDLNDAFDAALSGDKITLQKNLNTSNPIWMGTTSVNDTPRNLTLDLNGHTIRSASHVVETVILSHGALNIINSVPGEGGIYNEATSDGVAVQVHGSYLQNCNPRTQTPFTHLTISEGVYISASEEKGSGVAVYELDIKERAYSQFGVDYLTNIYREWAKKNGVWKHTEQGVANGVRVDINGHITAKKYGFKVNGNIDFPDVTKYGAGTDVEASRDSVAYWNSYVVSVGDTAYTPYIHIGSTALLEGNEDDASSAAVYASGWARYEIDGTLKGASGLYVRGGKVTVKNDAIIQSTFEGSASFTPGSSTSGIATKGNAIVVNPKTGYPGHIEFKVEGDAKVSTLAAGGAALLEDVATPDMLESIAINGGQFTGPYALAICEATQASGKVVVYGTTLTSENVADVSGIMAPGAHTTVINNADGTTTVIVSAGTPPTVITNWGNDQDPQEGEVVDLPDRTDANWTGIDTAEISSGNTITLGELQIISGTDDSNKQELIINDNATLQVERLIMNDYATITVAAGGTLIVDGTQGINAPSENNIVLETSTTTQPSFLFHPDVESNRHPLATVNMLAKNVGYLMMGSEKEYYWHRFALPIRHADGWIKTPNYGTWLYGWDYTNNRWYELDAVSDMIPFTGYTLSPENSGRENVTYTFKGELVGNEDYVLRFSRQGYNFFGNSYLGYMSVLKLVDQLIGDANIDGSVWMWEPISQTYSAVGLQNLSDDAAAVAAGTYSQSRYDDWQKEVAPMQTFILRLIGAETAETSIDYSDAIWGNPRYDAALGRPSSAPARAVNTQVDNAYMQIVVTAENGQSDKVELIENTNRSDAYESGYDASKYINESNINLFATLNDEEYNVLATDHLQGVVLSMQTLSDINYTMSFKHVQGTQYAIRDLMTNTITPITEGNTYTFVAQPNDVVEGRFVIVPIQNMPTDVETVETTTSVKGIYTIMGQYVGEDFDVLPAGVYVIDGVKIVK